MSLDESGCLESCQVVGSTDRLLRRGDVVRLPLDGLGEGQWPYRGWTVVALWDADCDVPRKGPALRRLRTSRNTWPHKRIESTLCAGSISLIERVISATDDTRHRKAETASTGISMIYIVREALEACTP